MSGNPAFRRPSKARLTTDAILQRAIDNGLASLPGGSRHRSRLLVDLRSAAAREMTFPAKTRWPPAGGVALATQVAFAVMHAAHRYIDQVPQATPELLVALSRVLPELERVVAEHCPLPTRWCDELRKVANTLVVAAFRRGGTRPGRGGFPPVDPQVDNGVVGGRDGEDHDRRRI